MIGNESTGSAMPVSEVSSSNQTGTEQLREAGEVYIKMHKNYRVSRNVRAHWFFDHINKAIQIDNEQTKDGSLCRQEMSVVGIVPKGGNGDEIVEDEQFRVCADTKVIYLSRYYRHAFVLDLSPSTFVGDDREGCCLHQKLLTTLRLSMANVAKTFVIPGTTNTFSPQIYATVCVFVPFLGFEEDLVLAQGVLLTEANVSEVVDQVTVKFNDILIKLYEFSRPIMQKWGQLRRRHRNKFDSFTEVNARGEIEYDDMAAYQARKQLHRKEVVKKYGRFFELPKGFKEADNSVEQHLQELKDATFPSRTNLFRRETSLHDQKKIAWNVTDEQRDDTVDAKVDGYIHPEWSLVFMLRLGLVATQMMPENTQSGIIVITDAVCGIPDQEAMQKLLAQLRSYTVSCSFIQLQANTGKGACFGHVPSSELVHFIAMATFGSYISPEDVGNIKIEPNKVPDILKSAPGTPKDEEEPTNLQNIEELTQAKILEIRASEGADRTEGKHDMRLNTFHRALLCWSFQNALQRNANVVKQIQSVNNEFLTFFMDDVRRHVHLQVQYQSNLHELLYVRLREGFALKEVRLEDDGRTIYVLLVLPFRSQLFIEYTLRAPWPASKTRGTVFVELILQGPTFELREILSERKHLGADRQDLVKITLNSIVEADALLLQLHEFNTRPCHYRIPKGINPHEGLFTIHNGLLRTPYAETKKLLMNGYAERIPFAEFWSTLLDMNDSLWQKWVHTHSERIVLKSLLPFDIFGPESAFRINCSDSESALHTMLQEMTSFSVIPDKLYVKFVCGDNKDAPEFFYIIRVCLAAPTVVLRISFLGGIRNHTRRYIVDSLRDKIRELNQKKSFAIEPENGQIRKGECPDTNVLFAIRRPMERILVRYDTIPLDLKTIVRIRENMIDASLDQIKQIKRHNAICSYMECRRQIIILPDLFDRGCFSLADNWDMAAFILNVLLQRRASEREGYQLAAKFESGAIALCRQRYHKIGPCLEQYVLFPPLQVELPTALRTNECKRVVTYNYNVLTTIMQPEENEIENRENVENRERKTKKVRLIDAKMEDSVDEPADRPVALVMETWNEPQVSFGNTQSEGPSHTDDAEVVSVLYSIDFLMRIAISKIQHDDPVISSFRSVDQNLSLEKLNLSARVQVTTSLISHTNALKYADRAIISLPLLVNEDQLTPHLISLFRNVLHQELIEEFDTFLDSSETELWKQVVVSGEGRKDDRTKGGKLQKTPTIQGEKQDSMDHQQSPVKCRLYLKQISQWELVVFVVPFSNSMDFYKDGLPISICVCCEPKIAYALTKRVTKDIGSMSAPPQEWYSMKRDFLPNLPTELTSDDLRTRFENGLQKQIEMTSLIILLSLGIEVRKKGFDSIRQKLISLEIPAFRIDEKLKKISQIDQSSVDLSKMLDRICEWHFSRTPFDDSLYFSPWKCNDSSTHLVKSFPFLLDKSDDKNFDINRLQELSSETKNSVFVRINAEKCREGVAWKNQKKESRQSPFLMSFACLVNSDFVTTKSVPVKYSDIKNSGGNLNDLENSKIDLFLTVHTLEKTNGLFDRREEIGEEKSQVAELALSTKSLLDTFIRKLARAFESELLLRNSRLEAIDNAIVENCLQTLKQICNDDSMLGEGISLERRQIEQLQCVRGRRLFASFLNSFDGTIIDYGKMRKLNQNTFYCIGIENGEKLSKFESSAKKREFQKVKAMSKNQHFNTVEEKKAAKGQKMNEIASKWAEFKSLGDRKNDFWLFLVIENNCADIYFCQRYDNYIHDRLPNLLSRIVRQRAHRVDQVLLLSRMYHKKRAEDLVIPRDSRKRKNLSRKINSYLTDEDDEDFYRNDDDYLADTIENERGLELIENAADNSAQRPKPLDWILPSARFFYPPGYFACPLQEALWFRIHSRLRTRGLQPTQQASAILCQYLQRFIIKNRVHTYVLRDVEDPHRHNVIYMRLHMNLDTYSDALNGGKQTADSSRGKMRKRQIGEVSGRFRTEILVTVCSLEPPKTLFLNSIRDTINRRLDDATLAQLINVFIKNSQTRLSAEDVQFIQKDPQLPALNLFISIPNKMTNYLSAVLYYSQQHLQAVLSLAKFKDDVGEIAQHESKSGSKESSGGVVTRAECIESGSSHSLPGRRTFMPFKVEGEMPSSYAPAFFLHLKTSRPGSTATGICCIEFRIVNAKGEIPESLPDGRLNESSSQLLAPQLNCSNARIQLYRELTRAQCYDSCGDRENIAAYAQAIVWQAGDVDLVDVQQSLEGVVKMALCDVVTEYGVLNGQIVEMSNSSHSAVGSGAGNLSNPPMSPAMHDMSQQKTPQSISSVRNASSATASASDQKRTQLRKRESLEAVNNLSHMQQQHDTPFDVSGNTKNKFTFDYQPRRGSNASEMDKSMRVTNSDEYVFPQPRQPDFISPRFSVISQDWFPFLVDLVPDCTSVYKQTWTFDCKQTIKKALTVVRDQIRRHAESQESIVLYEWSNLDRSHEFHENVDGKYESVAQQIQQNVSSDIPVDLDAIENSHPCFVFVGLVADVSIETKRYGFEPVGEIPETLKEFAEKNAVLFIPRLDFSFIPRQRLLCGVVRGSKFTLYFYNYHPTISTSIREIVTKTVHWHNARARLLREIGLHKIGITNLSPYETDLYPCINPYLALVWRNPDELIDRDYPSDIPPEMPHFEKLPPEYAQVLFRIYQDKCHFRINESTCLINSQLERLKSIRAGLAKRLNHYRTGKNIQNSFLSKCFKMREEDLSNLLRNCRLVHFVHTPVLLFPSWRRKIAEVRGKVHDVFSNKSISTTALTHTGSMSDVAMQTRRKASTPQSAVTANVAPQSPVQNANSGTRARTNTLGIASAQHIKPSTRYRSGDDPCMIKILYMLMQDYVRYMKTLDLEFVEVTELCKNSEEQRLYGLDFSQACTNPPKVLLAAAVQAGIILMVLSFSEPYFMSEFYVWTGDEFEGRIRKESSISDLMFMEEYMNELKVKCHIHSFTYDFHLRILSKYLIGKDEVLFNSGYNTHAFLIDFLEYYGCRPPNARNCVYQEHTKFELQHNVSANMIWEHFLKNNLIYKWRVVKLRNVDELERGERGEDEYMLVCDSFAEDNSDRELIRVVLRDRNRSEMHDKISLTFYLIAVSTNTIEPLEEERRRRDDSDNSSSGEFTKFERKNNMRPSFDSGDSSSPRRRTSSIISRKQREIDDPSDKADEMAWKFTSGAGIPLMNPDGSVGLSSSLSTSALRRRCSSGSHLSRLARETQLQKENENPNPQKSASNGKTPRFSDTEFPENFVYGLQKNAESDGEMALVNRSISIQSSSTAPRRHRKIHEGDIPNECIIYVYYQSGRQKRLQKALEDCVVEFSLSLKKNVDDALWLCRRDMMWQKILSLPTRSNPPVHSRLSIFLGTNSTKNQDPWNNLRWAVSDYLTSELETLISMVDKEAMEKREPRLKELLQGSSCARLCRFLFARFGAQRCRFFEYQNSNKKSLLITNPDDINTLFLIACEGEQTPSLSVLFKEKDDEPSAQTLLFRQQRLDTAFDDLIACVTAFLWSDLLQKPPGYT